MRPGVLEAPGLSLFSNLEFIMKALLLTAYAEAEQTDLPLDLEKFGITLWPEDDQCAYYQSSSGEWFRVTKDDFGGQVVTCTVGFGHYLICPGGAFMTEFKGTDDLPTLDVLGDNYAIAYYWDGDVGNYIRCSNNPDHDVEDVPEAEPMNQ